MDRIKNESTSYSGWKFQWAGICALLRTSVHLMREKDAKSCLPDALKASLRSKWYELGKNRSEYPIFWDFIHRERNNILKEYEFSAYKAILTQDGSIRESYPSLLSLMKDGEKEALLIKGGRYEGRLALEVLEEAVQWIENCIFDAIRNAGYDPHELRRTTALLPHIPSDRLSLLDVSTAKAG